MDNSSISAMSNILALACAFSFPFPFLSAFFFPDDPDAFWDFCPLPFCGCFPPGQWFWVVWFDFPHFAHFCPMFFTVENLLRDEPCPSAWAFLLDSSWRTHVIMSVNSQSSVTFTGGWLATRCDNVWWLTTTCHRRPFCQFPMADWSAVLSNNFLLLTQPPH